MAEYIFADDSGNVTVGDDVNCNIDPGDTTWVMVSSILVLSMMPALSFFEAGLLRSVNTVSLVTQIVGGVSVLCLMWNIFGYTLVYGRSWGGVIGNMDYIVMTDTPYDSCCRHAENIPAALFAFFEMMFAAITPLLMTGAFAERLRFKAFFPFIILWEFFVYYPVAHWIWGDGWLGDKGLGVQDFAGGIVIHATSGAGALVSALVLGHRVGFDKYDGEFPPSNLPLAALGAALLWTSWFGFNAGSALSSDALAVSTIVATQRAAVCSGIVWLTLSWWKHKPSAVALLNGVVAGLAGITPASGFIDPQYASILGVVLGLVSYFSIYLFKHKLRIDDALDVSSVHGMTGVVGSIAIGFFGTKSFNSGGKDGLFYGNNTGSLLGAQLLGVVVAVAWAGFVSFVLLKVLDKTVGLTLDDLERAGLDDLEHGEQAYGWKHFYSSYMPILNPADVNGPPIAPRPVSSQLNSYSRLPSANTNNHAM